VNGRRFSSNGEKHQTEPSKKYSTEDRGGCGGSGESAYQMDTQPGEKKKDCEVGREEDEQDFPAFEKEDAKSECQPGDDDQQHPEGITALQRAGRAGKDFEAVKEKKSGNGENRKAPPALDGEPRGSCGEFEPAGDEEVEEQGGDGRSHEDAWFDGSESAGDGEVKKDECETQ